MLYLQVSQTFVFYLFKIYFFNRNINVTNPAHHLSVFEPTTSTSNLRKHLFTDHIEEWITSCESLNISITSAAAIQAISKFRNEPPSTTLDLERPPYSKEAFINAILEFVVGDDQVCYRFLL
jgi:hypothetical protein